MQHCKRSTLHWQCGSRQTLCLCHACPHKTPEAWATSVLHIAGSCIVTATRLCCSRPHLSSLFRGSNNAKGSCGPPSATMTGTSTSSRSRVSKNTSKHCPASRSVRCCSSNSLRALHIQAQHGMAQQGTNGVANTALSQHIMYQSTAQPDQSMIKYMVTCCCDPNAHSTDGHAWVLQQPTGAAATQITTSIPALRYATLYLGSGSGSSLKSGPCPARVRQSGLLTRNKQGANKQTPQTQLPWPGITPRHGSKSAMRMEIVSGESPCYIRCMLSKAALDALNIHGCIALTI